MMTEAEHGARLNTELQAYLSDPSNIASLAADGIKSTLRHIDRLDPRQRQQVDDLCKTYAEWDEAKNRLRVHTVVLAAYHHAKGLSGEFHTISSGRDLSTPNAFMYPREDGGWDVRRYGPGTAEHPSWDVQGVKSQWTRTTFDVPSVTSQQTVERRFRCYSMSELAAFEIEVDWIIPNCLASGVPTVVGGQPKTFKSSNMLDLGISIAKKGYWLNSPYLPCTRQARCLYFMGEGGVVTAKEYLTRIAASKGYSLSDIDGFTLCDSVPQLTSEHDLNEMALWIKDTGAEFVFLDPLYQMVGSKVAGDVSNIFAMGALFKRLKEVCDEAHCTPILVHHFKKTGTDVDEPSLDDLSQAGCREYAGQWILLGRKVPYRKDTATAHLGAEIGSRLGFTQRWLFTITEGTVGAKTWQPQVEIDSDDLQTERRNNTAKQRVLDYLANLPDGQSLTAIRQHAGIRVQDVPNLLAEMVIDGLLKTKQFRGCTYYMLGTTLET